MTSTPRYTTAWPSFLQTVDCEYSWADLWPVCSSRLCLIDREKNKTSSYILNFPSSMRISCDLASWPGCHLHPPSSNLVCIGTCQDIWLRVKVWAVDRWLSTKAGGIMVMYFGTYLLSWKDSCVEVVGECSHYVTDSLVVIAHRVVFLRVSRTVLCVDGGRVIHTSYPHLSDPSRSKETFLWPCRHLDI